MRHIFLIDSTMFHHGELHSAPQMATRIPTKIPTTRTKCQQEMFRYIYMYIFGPAGQEEPEALTHRRLHAQQ